MEDTGKRLTCERTDVLRDASLFLSLSSVAFAFQIRIVARGAQYSAPTEAQVMADIFVRASTIHVKRSHLQTFRLLRYPTTVWAPNRNSVALLSRHFQQFWTTNEALF